MALLGVQHLSGLVETRYSNNLPTTLIRASCLPRMRTSFDLFCRQRSEIRCSHALSPLEFQDDDTTVSSSDSLGGEEFSHVMKFKFSDFKISDRVSIGLGGRGDEVVYEAIIKDTNSPLHNTRVVLRRLTSAQAQRRGKRAMQYDGGFSLRHWLRQTDWLPTLEATLALDEDSVRRVGDDTVGGPAVSRQLRVTRILMRDLLIGVNYLHSHGLAHTELRLENLHISPVDRHIKGNDPSCLREFLLRTLNRNTSHGNVGLQMLDRNWGAGWHLLSVLLAAKPLDRIRCLDALRHPFLCGPRWRVNPSMDIIRWSLGSTAVRITEEYIYGHQQRIRLAHFLELMEMLNPTKPKSWRRLLPGRWRLVYSTGRHIGLTTRQPSSRVLISDVHLTITETSKPRPPFLFTSDISFTVLTGKDWPHNKVGVAGKLQITSYFRLTAGKRLYLREEKGTENLPSVIKKLSGNKWRKALRHRELPSSLAVAKLVSGDIDVTLAIHEPLSKDMEAAKVVVNEVRMQIPPEIFDLSKIVCGTYVDSRMMVLRSVNGSALLFSRIPC